MQTRLPNRGEVNRDAQRKDSGCLHFEKIVMQDPRQYLGRYLGLSVWQWLLIVIAIGLLLGMGLCILVSYLTFNQF